MLIADLKAHHSDVADRIIGSVVVDAHHTTENQLLAKARDFYAEVNKNYSWIPSPSTIGLNWKFRSNPLSENLP